MGKLADVISVALESGGISAAEAAQAAGIPVAVLALCLERSDLSVISAAKRRELADVLGLPVMALMTPRPFPTFDFDDAGERLDRPAPARVAA